MLGNHFFQAQAEGQHEDILRNVQQGPDDIRWTIDQAEFDDLLALKKDLAPGPDGIPFGASLVVWVRSSSFLLSELAWKEVLFLIVLLKWNCLCPQIL